MTRPARAPLFHGSWMLGVILAPSGCASDWRPSLASVRTSEVPVSFAVATYLPRTGGSEWRYHQATLATPPGEARPYASRIAGRDLIEGEFVDRPVRGLSSLLRDTGAPDPDISAAIDGLFAEGKGFIVTFEPPLAMYPATLTPGEVTETRSEIRHFDRTGRHRSKGTVVRRVRCQGREDVATPAGAFPNCVRLQVDMTFRLQWGTTIETTEYLWLAREVGIVRRIERIAGLVWIFYFETTMEYALRVYRVAPKPTDTRVPDLRLTCAAVLFDRGLPQPTLAGMFQEFAVEAVAGQPETNPTGARK